MAGKHESFDRSGEEIQSTKPEINILLHNHFMEWNNRCRILAERKCIKEKIKYTDEPMGKVKVISEFLP